MNEAIEGTIDRFHRGKFAVMQPKYAGHRSGIDAMLLAAAVPSGLSGTVADFGAGAGAAGLAVAARCPAAKVALVENDPIMADFARRTLALPNNQAIAGRICVVEADLYLTGAARVASGLADRAFDFVIMNPPFNNDRDRSTPDALKAKAHVMTVGMFEAWLRTAAAVLKTDGRLTLIARPQSIAEILAACEGRFGGLTILPVLPRPEKPAIRVLMSGVKGSRAMLSLLPPLVLHGDDGNSYLPPTEEMINGLKALSESSL